jgi:nitroreductase
MDAMEAMRTRRSVGKLGGDVADEDLRAILEAALCAPNHHLTEPWQFTVVRGAARERLGEAWAALAAEDAPLQGEARDAWLRKEAAKPLRAPVLVVASVRTDPDPVVASEDFAATAAAVQNMLLAAHASGYGAMWRTGAITRRAEIATHLGLAAGDRIVGIVYLGRPAMQPPAAQPRAFDRVVRYLE